MGTGVCDKGQSANISGSVPSRREMIRLGLAALAGLSVSAVAPVPAFAADGASMLIGRDNDASSTTSLECTTTGFVLNVINWATGNSAGVISAQTTSSGPAFMGVTSGGGKVVDAQINSATNSSPVVYARTSGTGYPLYAEGGKAQLFMKPSTSNGAPSSGSHSLGEVYVDSAGDMYRCAVAGTPGTWAAVRSTVLLSTPRRVIDTRFGTGGITGPLSRNVVYTFPPFLSSAGIPAAAKGIIGNLTMVAPSGLLQGQGWMAIVPATLPGGTTAPPNYPGVSTINTPYNTDACANQYTVALGTGAEYGGKISIVMYDLNNRQYHAIVDVSGYII